MRNYLIAFFVLMAACAFGANVTFQSFNTNQFNANAAANTVSLNTSGTFGGATAFVSSTSFTFTNAGTAMVNGLWQTNYLGAFTNGNSANEYVTNYNNSQWECIKISPSVTLYTTIGDDITSTWFTSGGTAPAPVFAWVTNTFSGAQVVINSPLVVNGQVSGVVATNSNPEVYAYAANNGISDPAAIAALNGMETELKKFGVWANVVDVIPFYSRFNPANGNTFLGRTFTKGLFTASSWGVTNISKPIVVSIPYMTNGSMLVVYGKCPQGAPSQVASVAGWFNPGTGSTTNEYYLVNNPATYDGVVSVTNNAIFGPGGFNSYYPNSALLTWMGSDAAANNSNYVANTSSGPPTMGGDSLKVKCDFFSFNTNGTVTHFRDGIQDMFNPPAQAFTAPIPLVFYSGFSNIFIGQDPAVAYNTPVCQIAAVIVFNAEQTSNLVMAATRAARWLDPAQNNLVLVGDSRMWQNGLVSLDGGLQTDAANFNTYIYNISGSGQSAWMFTNSLVAGNRIAVALKTYANLGCVQNNDLIYGLGVNDFLLNGYSAVQVYASLTTFLAYTPNGYRFTVGTVYPMATNSIDGTMAALLTVNSSITAYNSMVFSNASLFSGGIVDQYALGVNYMAGGTNAANSIDGLHFYGTYGNVINSKLAQTWTRPQNNVSPAAILPGALRANQPDHKHTGDTRLEPFLFTAGTVDKRHPVLMNVSHKIAVVFDWVLAVIVIVAIIFMICLLMTTGLCATNTVRLTIKPNYVNTNVSLRSRLESTDQPHRGWL